MILQAEMARLGRDLQPPACQPSWCTVLPGCGPIGSLGLLQLWQCPPGDKPPPARAGGTRGQSRSVKGLGLIGQAMGGHRRPAVPSATGMTLTVEIKKLVSLISKTTDRHGSWPVLSQQTSPWRTVGLISIRDGFRGQARGPVLLGTPHPTRPWL